MNYKETSVLYGSNIYAREQVIHHTLDLELAGQPPVLTLKDSTLRNLYDLLPGLRDYSCGASLSLNHLFEHICIELQNLTGAHLRCVHGNAEIAIGDQDVVYPYEEEEVGLACVVLAHELIQSLLALDSRSEPYPSPTFDFTGRRDAFLKFVARYSRRVQDRAVMEAAAARDIPVVRLANRLFQLGQGRLQQRLSATKTTHTNVVSNDIAANKDYSRRILGELGLPIPRYVRVNYARQAVEAAERIGYPVVVKPNNGGMGRGVSVGMKNAREVRYAFRRARRYGQSCLVEELIPGSDFRMLVVDGRLIAAAQRVPAHVRGDGIHCIADLVREVNSDPRRGSGQRYAWTHLELDEKADFLLSALGYTHETVPAKEEVVYLRRNANTSDGGTAVDVTDEVHPDNRKIVVRAVKAVGLDIAGVDVLTTDISKSLWETGGCICEINSRPGLRKHMWPAEGKPRDVTGPIIDMLFPSGSNGRIPIITLTGSGDTVLSARMLAHILALDGREVGLATRHGIHVGGHSIPRADITGPAAARMILLDPCIDIAILESTPDDILDNGLGYDNCDISAVIGNGAFGDTANSHSDIGQLTKAIGVVAGATRGTLVFASDDEVGRKFAGDRDAGQLCTVIRNTNYVAATALPDASNRRVALEETSDGQAISISQSNRLVNRMQVKELVSREKVNPRAVQGLLYATALASSLGIAPESIHRGLSTFDDYGKQW